MSSSVHPPEGPDQVRRVNFRAGWVRLVIAGGALTLLPLTTPKIAAYSPLLAVYLVVAAIMQVIIWKDLGGRARVLPMGMIDLAVYTFFVQRLGSLSPVLVMLYVMIGILYTLANGLRYAQIIAAFGSVLYVGVIVCEAKGILPYAPDAPPWAARQPHTNSFVVAAIGFPVIFVWSIRLVGRLLEEIKKREGELEILSKRDALTKLANRRHLLERIELEVARVPRGHPLVAVMIDLDHFKHINDEHGHLKGDEMLAEVALALASATRKVDVIGRYGGDEFLVLLPDTNAEDARVVVDRLVRAVRDVGLRYHAEKPVTASVGVAEAEPTDDSISLMRRADQRAYEAKRAGGDCAIGVDPVPSQSAETPPP